MSPDKQISLDLGVEHLNAVRLADGDYAYRAEETGLWYRVSEDDVIDLGERIEKARACRTPDCADEPHDAYSHWCASCGEEISDLDHDAVTEVREAGGDMAYRCQCGTATGQRCEWTGALEDMTVVRWVPESDRGSAKASGTYSHGAYAMALTIESETCVDVVTHEYDPDTEDCTIVSEYAHVVGPAVEAD